MVGASGPWPPRRLPGTRRHQWLQGHNKSCRYSKKPHPDRPSWWRARLPNLPPGAESMRCYVVFRRPFRGELLKNFVLEHIFLIRPIITNVYKVKSTWNRCLLPHALRRQNRLLAGIQSTRHALEGVDQVTPANANASFSVALGRFAEPHMIVDEVEVAAW